MKITKYLSAGLVVLMGAAFAACDNTEEPSYIPAGATSDEQRVYFKTSSVSEIVKADQTSIEVPVFRPDTVAANELTVQLVSEDSSELFKIPTEVTFAAGETETQIVVGFDVNDLTPNTDYNFQITVDEAYANVYGIATVNVTINYEQMTEWTVWGYDPENGKTGIGMWYLGSPFSGSWIDPVRVLERHTPSDANNQQFRVQWYYMAEEGYASADIPVEDLEDPYWYTLFDFTSTDGGKSLEVLMFDCSDWIGYDGLYFGQAGYLAAYGYDNDAYWDEVTGVFTMSLTCYYGGYYYPDYHYIRLAGYADTNEYALTITDKGCVTVGDTDSYSVIDFQFNENVDYVNYTIVEGAIEDEEMIAAIAEEIQNPETTYTIYTVEEVGNQSIMLSTSGDYTIVAVGYNVDATGAANAKVVSTCVFTYTCIDPDANWTVVTETATLSENFYTAFWEEEGFEATYTVTVQKHDEIDGVIRVRDPFASNPYTAVMIEAGYFTKDKTIGEIQIDMTDPEGDGIYVPLSSTGLLYGGALISIGSYAAAGTYENNVISFDGADVEGYPSFAFMWGEQGAYSLSGMYLTLNLNGGATDDTATTAAKSRSLGSLELPESLTKVKTSKAAPARFVAKANKKSGNKFELDKNASRF